jgi:hypothetical protein
MSPIYVYGVMRAADAGAPAETGIVDAPIELVEHGPLAAVVSPVEEGAVRGRAQQLTAHTEVLRSAMRGGTVLPMRFGVLMPDSDAVRRDLLEARGPQLGEMLGALDGRAEMTVTAVYREDVLLREVVGGNREIAALRERVRGKPEAATYFDRVRLGELVAHAVDAVRAADQAAVIEELRPFAVALTPSDPLHERMAVNCAFLVEQDALGDFDAAVERVSAERAERMQFKLTGPLPPFSFVGAGEPAWG